jgi:holo-[acyl-carrier protein] synthase
MIIGIGSDIVDIARIERLYNNFGDKFLQRILTSHEIAESTKLILHSKKISFIAKRFAAKEAFVKALGTGFRDGIKFTDITVTNDHAGKPSLIIAAHAAIILKNLAGDSPRIYISLSDSETMALALVVLEAEI